jgi:pimeloyl-ACP methyl ester carboxylesterase
VRTHETVGRFRSAELAARFSAAYDAVLDLWAAEVTVLDAGGSYGTTRVHACGAPGAPPLILLHGGNSTSASWFANAGQLSRAHRVYAPDQIGAPGRSVPSGRPVRQATDLLT